MPRTSQSAGFDIGAFIVTIRYTHNVKKLTAPGNYLHSTEHTKWLIWYNETTARVVCTDVLYFPNSPRIYLADTWLWESLVMWVYTFHHLKILSDINPLHWNRQRIVKKRIFLIWEVLRGQYRKLLRHYFITPNWYTQL